VKRLTKRIIMDNMIVGLDIGTTKVCAVVAGTDEQGRINILGLGRAPSDGMTRGVVTHIDRTTNSITNAIAEAQSSSGVSIKSVIVGIAGDHIQSFQSRGVIGISGSDHEVTQADIDRGLQARGAPVRPENHPCDPPGVHHRRPGRSL
jgi:cell division protein FtsA